MEQKLNIAEILKNKPQGTKLYDLLRNIEVELDSISYTDYENIIWCRYNDVDPYDLYGYSTFGTERGWLNGLQILLPSKEMRDWRKFLWKKGDVLVNEDGSVHIIFEKFEDDAYTMFSGKYYYSKDGKKAYSYCEECDDVITKEFTLETEDAAKTYISFIEKRLDGKLNRETLEIEKAQLEFKDGDIVTQGVLKGVNVCIIKNCIDKIDNKYNYYASYNTQDKEIDYNDWSYFPFAKFATDSKKQQLFDALAKEGKAWDAEKKMLVDLKPKVRFKSFDKIVAFEEINKEWVCDMFSHYAKDDGRDIIIGIGGLAYLKALPFNEETAKLIGTTDDWKG